ncbi:unnamed protein product [Vitrella brassicaformis CCMP3155]|uniref:Uncharacterized protein n=2 Tax=Vitrella brassicaformis TaxID=1169539 RepID=A0A0G4ECW7_VITBC|nr:unnamed protein product [Vitrella brassicaformis CCMP3155]|eukprot:CEL93167.1 unnamed protein product [Vitrella brassicaformis CCMP3155]
MSADEFMFIDEEPSIGVRDIQPEQHNHWHADRQMRPPPTQPSLTLDKGRVHLEKIGGQDAIRPDQSTEERHAVDEGEQGDSGKGDDPAAGGQRPHVDGSVVDGEDVSIDKSAVATPPFALSDAIARWKSTLTPTQGAARPQSPAKGPSNDPTATPTPSKHAHGHSPGVDQDTAAGRSLAVAPQHASCRERPLKRRLSPQQDGDSEADASGKEAKRDGSSKVWLKSIEEATVGCFASGCGLRRELRAVVAVLMRDYWTHCNNVLRVEPQIAGMGLMQPDEREAMGKQLTDFREQGRMHHVNALAGALYTLIPPLLARPALLTLLSLPPDEHAECVKIIAADILESRLVPQGVDTTLTRTEHCADAFREGVLSSRFVVERATFLSSMPPFGVFDVDERLRALRGTDTPEGDSRAPEEAVPMPQDDSHQRFNEAAEATSPVATQTAAELTILPLPCRGWQFVPGSNSKATGDASTTWDTSTTGRSSWHSLTDPSPLTSQTPTNTADLVATILSANPPGIGQNAGWPGETEGLGKGGKPPLHM